MEIKIIGSNVVEITGNIKSLEDYAEIKNTIMHVIGGGHNNITINVKDSLSMVSSVIGYFIKVINIDKVELQVNVWDERLYNLLDQLSLVGLFKVKLNK